MRGIQLHQAAFHHLLRLFFTTNAQELLSASQTDGEPIPSLEVNELTASVKDYTLLTAAIEQVSPVPMRFDEIEGDAKGYYSDADKEICIQVGMGESQTIKTSGLASWSSIRIKM